MTCCRLSREHYSDPTAASHVLTPAGTRVDSVPGPAGRAQSLVFGLVPQILPTMALQASIDALRWSRVSVILLAILGTIVFADLVSPRIRRGLG